MAGADAFLGATAFFGVVDFGPISNAEWDDYRREQMMIDDVRSFDNNLAKIFVTIWNALGGKRDSGVGSSGRGTREGGLFTFSLVISS